MGERAPENAAYVASVNYALCRPETATSLIAPDERCVEHTPSSAEALLVGDLDLGAPRSRRTRP